MAKIPIYSDINDLIEQIKGEDVSYRNLHTPIYIRHTNRITQEQDTFVIPYKSIIRDYMPYLKESAVTVPFGEIERMKYRYKPKRLSNDLYNTPELWDSLLELNYMVSIIDFTLEKPIQVFEPKKFKTLLNEVLILEGILN